MGSEAPLRSLVRDEEMLLSPPHPPNIPVKLWSDQRPLDVVHFPAEYEAVAYAPPRAVYQNDDVMVEWQTLNGRQPFYHRNSDVDEISYQVAGQRTLMTDLGSIEFETGEFSRIPRGVAHDNYCVGDIHLLFYVQAPVAELIPGHRESQPLFPPFPGWEPAPVNELVSSLRLTPQDVSVFPIDERELLEHVLTDPQRMPVLRPEVRPGVTWLFATDHVQLGHVRTETNRERRYRRTLDADEVQYQISGRRTLLTQRGIVELEPGDFVLIPLGVSHAGVGDQSTEYISIRTRSAVSQIAETTRTADPFTTGRLDALTAGVSS